MVAVGFRERLAGIRGVPWDHGLLLWGRSVHGRGLRRALAVVAVDATGTVAGTRILRPGGVVVFRRPGWMLEIPAAAGVPAAGASLVMTAPS